MVFSVSRCLCGCSSFQNSSASITLAISAALVFSPSCRCAANLIYPSSEHCAKGIVKQRSDHDKNEASQVSLSRLRRRPDLRPAGQPTLLSILRAQRDDSHHSRTGSGALLRRIPHAWRRPVGSDGRKRARSHLQELRRYGNVYSARSRG